MKIRPTGDLLCASSPSSQGSPHHHVVRKEPLTEAWGSQDAGGVAAARPLQLGFRVSATFFLGRTIRLRSPRFSAPDLITGQVIPEIDVAEYLRRCISDSTISHCECSRG